MVPFVGGFFEICLGMFIGGVWACTSRGSGVGATLIFGTGVIVSGSIGDDVGTTLGSELRMVGGRHDLGGCSCSAQDLGHLYERIFFSRAKGER